MTIFLPSSPSVVMFALVAFLGAVVLRYSATYLDGDRRHATFLRLLALTIAAVMLLVTAGNLWLFVGAWIGASLALQRLLLFYGERPTARRAARKKFVVARIGDASLAAACVLLARAFDTTDIATLLARANALGAASTDVTPAAMLLVLAAALKAAAFPTHGWLVEMMDTPTPVSALLHAGILNGGAFLVLRFAPVVQHVPAAQYALLAIGGVTAIAASVARMAQPSVKVSLAYSSAAHMGFTLLLCGLGAYPAALLHLVAHSCYKAHAFLSAGSAVDAVRKTRVPDAKAPNARRLVASGAAAVAITVTIAMLAGARPLDDAVSTTLATVLALGLTALLAQDGRVAMRLALGAVSTATAFYLLERGATRALASELPAATHGASIGIAPLVALVAAFALVTVLQLVRPTIARRWGALHVHARNGFYASAWFDRLVGLPRATRARHFMEIAS